MLCEITIFIQRSRTASFLRSSYIYIYIYILLLLLQIRKVAFRITLVAIFFANSPSCDRPLRVVVAVTEEGSIALRFLLHGYRIKYSSFTRVFDRLPCFFLLQSH